MALLTDTDLIKIITDDIHNSDDDKLVIYPYDNQYLTPVGYDLRVGGMYVTTGKREIKSVREKEPAVLPPNSTSLITTYEEIHMPQSRLYSGLIESKVSKVSMGLSHISTTVDPDWKGNLLIAVHNHSSREVKLGLGEPFCTMVIVENKSKSTAKSGHDPGRSKLLLNQFAATSKGAKVKSELLNLVPPTIIIGFTVAGYFKYGNAAGFPAMVACGVAISQYVSSRLK